VKKPQRLRVVVGADVELGGTDQLFNLLVGRHIMREFDQAPQCVLTTPLLEGLDGRMEDGVIVGAKMSKSLGNYVGVDEAPLEMFGKLMSISDDLMWRYFELLSFRSVVEISALRRSTEEGANPRDVKYELALEIVARFHSKSAADRAKQAFVDRFQKGVLPEDLQEVDVDSKGEGMSVTHVMRAAGLVASTSEGLR
jgi:tyrosyl-tRNA synthetase